MGINANTTCIGIRSSGFPRSQSYAIINIIQKWIRCCGAEWTVGRLKEYKLMYLRQLAGDNYHPEWIRIHHDGSPKGPMRFLWKTKKPQKAISALMVYTAYVSKSVTPSQWKKFHSSVERQQNPFSDLDTAPRDRLQALTGRLVEMSYSDWCKVKPKGEFASISSLLNKSIRVPNARLNCARSAANTLQNLADSFNHPLMQWWWENVTDMPSEFITLAMHKQGRSNRSDWYVGRIGLIQEPGYKLRAVANPLPGFQLALSRLGKRLYSYLRSIPQDCTFDQERGVNEVAEQLKKEPLTTLDLSDATNNFPLGVISYCLRSLQKQLSLDIADIMLFEAVSRQPWMLPSGLPQESITWTHGQPLGLYPSFAAFAITHHFVAQASGVRFYRMLGDDIVVDQKSAPHLVRAYRELGVPLSEAKCFSSPVFCEFAGKAIYMRGDSVKSLVQPKHKTPSDRSFMDLVANMGEKFINFLRPRQQKVARTFVGVSKEHHRYGLLKNTSNPVVWEYSRLVSEAEGNEEELIEYRTKHSKVLEDLKVRMQLRNLGVNKRFTHVSEPPYDDTSVKTEDDFESRLLVNAGVTRAKFIPGEAPRGWSVDQPSQGDPRGRTQLDVLESSLSRLRRQVEKNREAYDNRYGRDSVELFIKGGPNKSQIHCQKQANPHEEDCTQDDDDLTYSVRRR